MFLSNRTLRPDKEINTDFAGVNHLQSFYVSKKAIRQLHKN